MRSKPTMSAREAIKKLNTVTKNYKRVEEAKKSDFSILLMLAVKLYMIKPDDHIFTGDTLKPEFVDHIKKKALERIEFEAEEAKEFKELKEKESKDDQDERRDLTGQGDEGEIDKPTDSVPCEQVSGDEDGCGPAESEDGVKS